MISHPVAVAVFVVLFGPVFGSLQVNAAGYPLRGLQPEKYGVATQQQERQLAEPITIEIKPVTGTIFSLGVETSDTIGEVKKKIYDEENIPTTQQILIFHGKVLDNEKTVADYNIQENNKVHMAMASSSTVSTQSTKVTSTTDTPISVTTQTTELPTTDSTTTAASSTTYAATSVSTLSTELSSTESASAVSSTTNAATSKTIPASTELPYTSSAAASSPEIVAAISESVVHIKVKTVRGSTFVFVVKPSDTMLDIAIAIQEKVGVFTQNQILICKGQRLDETKTVSDYNMEDGCSIMVAFRDIST